MYGSHTGAGVEALPGDLRSPGVASAGSSPPPFGPEGRLPAPGPLDLACGRLRLGPGGAWERWPYSAYFCEENALLLCRSLVERGRAPLHELSVCFISNEARRAPVWCQAAGHHEKGGLVFWDYHVVVVQAAAGREPLVWDLDSTLPFPSPLSRYAREALQPAASSVLPPELQLRFRVVPGASFARHFASDRSHMRRSDGVWEAPPPPYPPVSGQDGVAMNLCRYTAMSDSSPLDGRFGRVFTFTGLARQFERLAGPVGPALPEIPGVKPASRCVK